MIVDGETEMYEEAWQRLLDSEEALDSTWRVIESQAGVLSEAQINTLYSNILELSELLDDVMRDEGYYDSGVKLLIRFVQEGEKCLKLIRDPKLKGTIAKLISVIKKYVSSIDEYKNFFQKNKEKNKAEDEYERYRDIPTFLEIAEEIKKQIRQSSSKDKKVELSQLRNNVESIANRMILTYHLRKMTIDQKLKELTRNVKK